MISINRNQVHLPEIVEFNIKFRRQHHTQREDEMLFLKVVLGLKVTAQKTTDK